MVKSGKNLKKREDISNERRFWNCRNFLSLSRVKSHRAILAMMYITPNLQRSPWPPHVLHRINNFIFVYFPFLRCRRVVFIDCHLSVDSVNNCIHYTELIVGENAAEGSRWGPVPLVSASRVSALPSVHWLAARD